MFKWNSYTIVEVLIIVALSALGVSIIEEIRRENVVPTPIVQTTSSSQIRVMEKVDFMNNSVRETLIVLCDKGRGNLIYKGKESMFVIKQAC